MLALHLATSDLLMKIPRTPLRPASLSVDQGDVFMEMIATVLLFKPNFISKWHMVLKPFSVVAFWTPPPSDTPSASFPRSPIYMVSAIHKWTQQWQPDCHYWLRPTKKKKKNPCKETAVVVNQHHCGKTMCLLNALKGSSIKEQFSQVLIKYLNSREPSSSWSQPSPN